MRSLFILFFFSIASMANAYAGGMPEPVINKNVHVIQNANTAQCPSSFNGKINPEVITGLSRNGESDTTNDVGMQSCTGCAIDPASHDCVCKTCYGYFN